MKLVRFSGNPIIAPTSNWWETQATFNPGATLYNGEIILLYRAIGGDNLSRFGLASSKDGLTFERQAEPAIEGDIKNPYERLGIEDPRITKIDETYYIVYTAPSVYEASSYKKIESVPSLTHQAPWRIRPSLITTKDFKVFERRGLLLELDTKDAMLFPEKIEGKYVLLHRLYPHVYLSYSDDLVNWSPGRILFSPRAGFWDNERVGVGSVPIKTEKGWLLFYHGVDQKRIYRIGCLLLASEDPTIIVYRSNEAIFEPVEDYEKVGLTPNIVFTCGAIERDNKFFIYYGGADEVVGLATIDKKELLEQLKT